MSMETLNEEAARNLEQASANACHVNMTLRQSGVEVTVGGTDVDLVEATFDALYEKYKAFEGYKGAAPAARKDEDGSTRARIAKNYAIRTAIAAKRARGE